MTSKRTQRRLRRALLRKDKRPRVCVYIAGEEIARGRLVGWRDSAGNDALVLHVIPRAFAASIQMTVRFADDPEDDQHAEESYAANHR